MNNSSGPEVLCIGEALVLVTPADADSLVTAETCHLSTAGAEANVASHLASLGRRAAWAGRLGDDELGRRVRTELSARGVDLRWVEQDAVALTGMYLKEPGRAVRYYRTGSAASRMSPDSVGRLPLDAASIVHLSGVTPALSRSCDDFVETVLSRRSAGTVISFDVNYRPPLWPALSIAARRLQELAALADIVLVGLDEAAALWGTTSADDVRDLLPGPSSLIVKDGGVEAVHFGSARTAVPALPTPVVEPVGAGDAFAAGLLHARLDDLDASEQLLAGHRQAVLALRSPTDFPALRRAG